MAVMGIKCRRLELLHKVEKCGRHFSELTVVVTDETKLGSLRVLKPPQYLLEGRF
jgi:hypothetical protein